MLTDGGVAAKPDWKQLLTFLRGSRYKYSPEHTERWDTYSYKVIESTKLQ